MDEEILKEVYFVRHGESESNVARTDDDESSLTAEGRKQAEFLAKRFQGNIPIDVVLSSTIKRASETAEIISGALDQKIEFSELIVERRYPSLLQGKPWEDKEFQGMFAKIRENVSNNDWRYADEENFYDLKERGLRAVEWLESRSEKSILVVSHGGFIKVILAAMMHQGDILPEELYRFYKFFRSNNTGITWCRQYEKKGWRCLTWNDHAHLGEATKK